MGIKDVSYTLSDQNIDAISKMVDEELIRNRLSSDTKIRIRLSIEEILLRFRDHFGEAAVINVSIGKSFHKQIVELEIKGEAFNPLRNTESGYEDWSRLLTRADYSPYYQYNKGNNVLRWAIPLRKHHPVVTAVIAIIAGVLFGVAGSAFFPDEVKTFIMNTIFGSIETIWIRLLNAMSGPVMFLIVITTVLNMDGLKRLGGSNNRFMRRIIIKSTEISVFVIALGFLLYQGIDKSGDPNWFRRLMSLFVSIFPEDSISPFISSNSIQLLFIALVLGTALVASGRRYDSLATIIREANDAGMILTKWMSSLVPLFTFCYIALDIMRGKPKVLIGLWQCILLSVVVAILFMIIETAQVSITEKIGFKALMKKLSVPFLKSIKRGSTESTYELTLKNCKEQLGLEGDFSEAGLTVGLVAYMPVSVANTLIYSLYAASMFDVTATPVWLLLAVLLSIALSIANPPVPGVSLLSFAVIFVQLGIPAAALAAAMIFDVLTNVLTSAMNQYVLQLELIRQAKAMGMLDHRILESNN